ncbi:MAG: archaeal proteasome endopeptidase complex subunit alpha [Candidatus Diapherotrites archaeon]|nr:archaeal proteasome endopeptidase complex subunit alpha [Candidatus Diapherotrites archaeon]MDZ4256221.1 archaeal proteasome endopeptidase complex subunit alpha [archaeon]
MYPGSAKSAAYDRSATMFSPDGRLYQVEYASKIVQQGTTGAACVYKGGVVFGTDKNVTSKLILPDSIEKLFKIDDHIAAVSAGLVGDARRLIQGARQRAQENIMFYDDPIHVETLAKDISSVKQAFTQYAGMRPFGVAFIIGGVDESGPRLFETEPSGALAEYMAVAVGSGRKEVMDFFEKNYSPHTARDPAARLVYNALESSMPKGTKLSLDRVDFGYIEAGKPFQRFAKSELKSILGSKGESAE